MNFLKGLWAWYLARKLWQKVVIGIFALGGQEVPLRMAKPLGSEAFKAI